MEKPLCEGGSSTSAEAGSNDSVAIPPQKQTLAQNRIAISPSSIGTAGSIDQPLPDGGSVNHPATL